MIIKEIGKQTIINYSTILILWGSLYIIKLYSYYLMIILAKQNITIKKKKR